MTTSSKEVSSTSHTLRRALILPFGFVAANFYYLPVSTRVCIFIGCLIPSFLLLYGYTTKSHTLNVPNALYIILNSVFFGTSFLYFPVNFRICIFLGCLITSFFFLLYMTKSLLVTGAGILVMTVVTIPDVLLAVLLVILHVALTGIFVFIPVLGATILDLPFTFKPIKWLYDRLIPFTLNANFFVFNQGVDESVDGCTIGKLFVSNRKIAVGSNGTIVLEGTYEGRPVAVKRLVKAYHDVAAKEYQNLCLSDGHPNIVRLYGVEEDKDFVYLALERCTGSLNDLIQMQFLDAPTTNGDQATEVNIEYKVRLQSMKGTLPEVKLWEDNGYPSLTLWKLMRDMVKGLVHLHKLGMVHRDLKPQNVLIVKEGSLCAKLADMGISKRLVGDKSSLGNHATGCGTSGWQAPELLLHGRHTRAIDVFSLGCVLFYCITGGKHPFGDPLVRDMNIVKGKVKLFLVKHIPEAMDLLDHLLDPKAELRPKASEVLIHPMFWDSDKRLSFLRDASDRVQREDSESAILKELERIAPRVLGTKPASKRGENMVLLNWDKKIDPSLLNDIDNSRWYYYHRVRDLVRLIRNKMNHFFDLPREIQDTLGPVPEGFDGYFRSRFPKLLMEVYKVLHKYCTEEEWFKRYFKGSAE